MGPFLGHNFSKFLPFGDFKDPMEPYIEFPVRFMASFASFGQVEFPVRFMAIPPFQLRRSGS